MNIDIQKAKRALDALSQELQAQNDRLQLAVQAKQHLDQTIALRTQSLFKR